MTFPARFQRSDVNDDAAAGISAFAQTNDQHVTGNPKILHCARQRETVGRDDAAVCLPIDQALAIEILGIDDRAIDIGENLERSEEHTSELQSLMRTSYAVFCLKQKT